MLTNPWKTPPPLDRGAALEARVSPHNVAVIRGQRCVNRAGLAEMSGWHSSTVRAKTAPAARPVTGCPEPVGTYSGGRAGVGRQQWFPLAGALRWVLESIEAVRPPQVPWPDDPDEPIDGEQFRVEVMRAVPSVAAFRGWLRSSRRAWAIGEQGYLPRAELAD